MRQAIVDVICHRFVWWAMPRSVRLWAFMNDGPGDPAKDRPEDDKLNPLILPGEV